MDRLLQWGLGRFIRRGNLRVTTASGSVFHFGDGTGTPVAVRFTSKAAQRAVMLDPELKVGEAYMDGTLLIEEGTIADLLALVLGQTPDGMPPDLGAAAVALPLSQPPAAAVQPAVPGAAQCRAPLRSRRPALFAVPRRRPAIQLRLFRDARPVARRRAARQEAPSRRQAAAQRGRRPPRARHRLRLGRACALSRRVLPRAGHRHHAVARSSLQSRRRARQPKRT